MRTEPRVNVGMKYFGVFNGICDYQIYNLAETKFDKILAKRTKRKFMESPKKHSLQKIPEKKKRKKKKRKNLTKTKQNQNTK